MIQCPKFKIKRPAFRAWDLGFDSDFGFRISDLAGLCALCLFLFPFPSAAQSTAILPLEGWYRTGRYMPVRIDLPGPVTISADGAVPSQFHSSSSSASAIVPLLIFATEARQLRIDGSPLPGDPPLRPLSSHQQLVAVAGTGDRLAAKMFPGESILTIHVDPLDPLPGPELAWQTLDALIVDGPWPGSFDSRKLPGLLAGGTEVALHSPNRPDDALPWEPIDGGWVLRPSIAGPLGCDGSDAAYLPWSAWHPDLPAAVRFQVVLAGVLFSLAVLACLLLPRRFLIHAVAAATICAIVAIECWQSRTPKLFLAQGSVMIEGQPLLQTDRWQFLTSRQSTAGEIECTGECWPVFAESSQPTESSICLSWNGAEGRFTFRLPAQGKFAFFSKALRPQPISPVASGSGDQESPMAGLGRALYLQNHEKLDVEPGQKWNADDPAPTWPTVHVRGEIE
jgi:hypothetical protein